MRNRLVCPHCQCQLDPPSGQSTGMSCPRCTTWLDIDPGCKGSCMACHKANQEQSTTCVEAASPSGCSTDKQAPPWQWLLSLKAVAGINPVDRSQSSSSSACGDNDLCHEESEKRAVNVVQRDGWAGASDKDTSPVKTWRTVVGKLFHVR
ncbi:MAG TPA: hypothetical protein V6C81_14540 [Planktothrix sp.]